jgi:hypothetical protein
VKLLTVGAARRPGKIGGGFSSWRLLVEEAARCLVGLVTERWCPRVVL